MLRYAGKKILSAIPVLLGISMLAFVLGLLSPGDPAEFVLSQNGLTTPTEAELVAMREELGLNVPAYIRYWNWFLGLVQGNLGESYVTGRNIGSEIMLRLPLTLTLAIFSLVLTVCIGLTTGVVCAEKEGSKVDGFVKSLTNIMLSVPGFWLALVLILVFCEKLRVLPTSGSDGFVNFILPSIVLSFATMGTICRFMRGAMLEEFSKQYYLVAKVRGLAKSKLLFAYALPNALIPVIALLGNYFAGVLGGSAIVESIFAIPGMGSMALEAIRMRDYPVLQAYVLVSGWILVLVTLGVDLLIAYLNPKIRFGERL
ncbi:MAG: ABC transporter permease [Phascolarctobacterium sp.]|nr:ABC transporter permease [Phascolarctobacterium sp.]